MLVGIFPKCRLLLVKLIERGDKIALLTMGFIFISQEPLNGLVVAPFNPLCNFIAHKVELCTWMCHLIHGQRAHTSKLTPIIAWHTRNERAFAVDNLIVRKRQDEVLVKGIHE